jgi:hypothetical protein
MRGTDVEYPDFRVRGQEVTGFGSPERILNISEMPDDTDFPYPSPRGNRSRWSVEGLVDDPNFGSKTRRQFFDGFRLQRDEPVGKLEGFSGGGIGVDVPVDICAGQGQKKGSVWMRIAEPDDTVVTSPGVEGDEAVRTSLCPCFEHSDAVTQVAQDA